VRARQRIGAGNNEQHAHDRATDRIDERVAVTDPELRIFQNIAVSLNRGIDGCKHHLARLRRKARAERHRRDVDKRIKRGDHEHADQDRDNNRKEFVAA